MRTLALPLEPLVLSIGNNDENGPLPDSGKTPVFLDFESFDAAMLRKLEPEHVISWLFCEHFDACDVARVLAAAGFAGRFSAHGPRLPNARAVAREIRSCFPTLAFELVCPAEQSRGARRYHSFLSGAGGKPALPAPPLATA